MIRIQFSDYAGNDLQSTNFLPGQNIKVVIHTNYSFLSWGVPFTMTIAAENNAFSPIYKEGCLGIGGGASIDVKMPYVETKAILTVSGQGVTSETQSVPISIGSAVADIFVATPTDNIINSIGDFFGDVGTTLENAGDTAANATKVASWLPYVIFAVLLIAIVLAAMLFYKGGTSGVMAGVGK